MVEEKDTTYTVHKNGSESTIEATHVPTGVKMEGSTTQTQFQLKEDLVKEIKQRVASIRASHQENIKMNESSEEQNSPYDLGQNY